MIRLQPFLFLLAGLTLFGTTAFAEPTDAWHGIERTGEIRWGADATGGAPFIFSDPEHPARYIGFEVEIMKGLARHLGVKPVLVLTPWEQLVPALQRGNFDIAFNGLEVTPERAQEILFSRPYYYFSEQITVRKGDRRFKTLEDLRGHRAGTLGASLAFNLLSADPRITTVPYPSPVQAYEDLALGRTDAVVMDVPIAAWYAGPNPQLENAGDPIAESPYAAGLRKDSPLLQEKLNEAITAMVRSGELETIYRKWNIWTPAQKKLTEVRQDVNGSAAAAGRWWRYWPLLLQGAGMTLLISFLSMALAIAVGIALCLGKMYGGGFARRASLAYIEVIRGTPLLVQLYLLYYGLPNIGIQLNAIVAAVLGMGLNYAAYEAEIYRAGLLSVPNGQWEAARSLGMTPGQSLRYIVAPQAVRTALPPTTNDFIALLKDTSIVSIITVTELTKVYSTAASATFRFLELGLVTAALYFLMSYPLSIWSRHLERERHAVH